MKTLSQIVPLLPSCEPDWNAVLAAFPMLQAMNGSSQDPGFHAEGDVLIHTQMVCAELAKLPLFRDLPAGEKTMLMTAAIFHDCAKPATVTRDETTGRLSNPAHSRKGAQFAWNALWRAGAGLADLRAIHWLIHRHMMPAHFLEDADRNVIAASQELRLSHLAILVEADMRGRVCVDRTDQQRGLESVQLFAQYAAELGCLEKPFPFARNYARWDYLNERGRPHPSLWQATAPHDAVPATILCGLPGAGKSTAARAAGCAVISLDLWREKLGIGPDENSGPAVQGALGEVKQRLARREPVCWESTNLTREMRGGVLQLFRAYRAIPHLVYLHVDYDEMLQRNRARKSEALPIAALDRMAARFELPAYREAPEVEMRA